MGIKGISVAVGAGGGGDLIHLGEQEAGGG